MTRSMLRTTLVAGLLLATPASAVLLARAPGAPPVHRVLLLSRKGVPGRGAIPGFGPRQRAAAPGGAVLVADLEDASFRPAPLSSFGGFDASGLDVSPDGDRVAVSTRAHEDADWRITIRDSHRGDVITFTDDLVPETAGRRYDDLSPRWVDDTTLVFLSTR